MGPGGGSGAGIDKVAGGDLPGVWSAAAAAGGEAGGGGGGGGVQAGWIPRPVSSSLNTRPYTARSIGNQHPQAIH